MRKTDSGGNTSWMIALSSCALAQVVAERLLDDHPAPASRGVRVGEAVLLELADRRRGRTSAGSTGRTRGCRRCRAPGRGPSMVCRRLSKATSSSKSPGTNRKPSASWCQTSSRNSVRACSLTESCTICAKSWSAQSRRAKPTRREARRQQPAVGQVVDRRHHLLAGQVAGDAEDAPCRTARRSAAAGGPAGRAAGSVASRRSTSPERLAQRRPGRPSGRSRCSRSTGRPWSASTCASPAAWAVISRAEGERPVGDRRGPRLGLAGDLQVDARRPGRPCGTARSSAGTAAPSRTSPVGRPVRRASVSRTSARSASR